MNIIIIANGLFPEKPWVDTLLGGADRVVCCDGAIEKYLGWRSQLLYHHHKGNDGYWCRDLSRYNPDK